MTGKRQYAVLDAMKAFSDEHGYAPTFRQICDATGIKSLSGVSYYLNKLQDEGLIVRGPLYSSRSIHITGSTRMDGRKHSSRAACVKKSAAGRKGKGVDALTSKRDPDLQKRIDDVVAKAKEAEGNGVDVVRDYPRWNTLKASRVS